MVNQRQECLLRHLLECHSLSCNAAGDWLVRKGLAKPVGAACSNNVLAGSAVLRSLDRLGLVVKHHDPGDRIVYLLTGKGQVAANLLDC